MVVVAAVVVTGILKAGSMGQKKPGKKNDVTR